MMETKTNLKCAKWSRQDDGLYICSQNQKDACGCLSDIDIMSVNIILTNEQKNDRQKYIDIIKKCINEKMLALITGAGVSKPAGMPLWNDLISQMMGYAIQYNFMKEKHLITKKNTFFDNLNYIANQLIKGDLKILSKVNPLESAEYIAQFLDDESFIDGKRDKLPDISIKTMIRHIIDHSFRPIELLMREFKDRNLCINLSSELTEYNEKDFIASVREKYQNNWSKIASLNTMFAVSYLMYNEKGIRQIMTYNFEPLVQEHLLDLYGLSPQKILTHPGKFGTKAWDTEDGLREIYHVHGFVPGKRHIERENSYIFPAESDYIILSEDSYYKVENNEAYNWSSSIQSYFLNKYNCLFVGFSADDYNFRRILRQTRLVESNSKYNSNNTKKHFLIMSIDGWLGNIYEDMCRMSIKSDKKIGRDALNEISEKTIILTQQILKCREEYWKRFNIFPIWVTTKEIPELLTSFIDP